MPGPEMVRRNFRQYDRDQRQAGLLCPTSTGWFWSAGGTTTANQARFVRCVPSRAMRITGIRFALTTASASDDPVDVGLYDSALARLASSGATLALLNGATGMKTLSFTSPVTIAAGSVYYAAMSVNNVGTPVIGGAGYTSATFAQFFGATAGILEAGVMTAGHPLPSTLTINGAAATAWALGLIEG